MRTTTIKIPSGQETLKTLRATKPKDVKTLRATKPNLADKLEEHND